jgi:tetratricopeptide (TPR) repeat protein
VMPKYPLTMILGDRLLRKRAIVLMSCLVLLCVIVIWNDWQLTSSANEESDHLQNGYLSLYFSVHGFAKNFWMDEAVRAFEEASATGPKNAEAFLMAAITHELVGDYQKAASYYQQADQLAPDLGISALLGDMWYRSGEYKKARNAYEKVLLTDGEMIKALQGLALTMEKLGDYEQTVRLFEQMILVDSTRVESYVALSDFYYRNNNLAQALKVLEQVDEVYRFNVSYQTQLGLIYYTSQQAADACRALDNAIYLGTDDQWVLSMHEELDCQ